jgi:putative endonuclease
VAGGSNRKVMYFVYILLSEKLDRYYVGSTNNIVDRLKRHNGGQGKYTSKGVPWELITSFEVNSRSEAVNLEMKIKKRGIKRYLLDINFGV